MRRALRWLVGITLVVGTTLAQADVVSPPPTDCPAGTRAATSHAGPHCLPLSCGDDQPCPSGQVCALEGLCWVERTFTNRNGQQTVQVARGRCEHGRCSEGTCRAERVCMAEVVGTGGQRTALGTGGLRRPEETGGSRTSAASPDTSPEPTPLDRPGASPAGCRGVAAVGAVVGGVMIALLAAIAFLLRRRPSRPRVASKRTTRRP